MKFTPSQRDLTLMQVGLQNVDIIWNNLTLASLDGIGVDHCFELSIGIGTGNPGVFRANPHPYPWKPVPVTRAQPVTFTHGFLQPVTFTHGFLQPVTIPSLVSDEPPLLETLGLEAINLFSGAFPVPTARIIHPHLKSLELDSIAEETVVSEILDSLFLPALEEWIHVHSPILPDHMKSFGHLSSCLKIVKITAGELDKIPLLLSHLSSLAVLELRRLELGTREFFTQLLCLRPLSTISSRLQSLTLAFLYYVPWNLMLPMFSLTHWKSLKVKVETGNDRVVNKYGHHDREIVKQLLQLVDGGFDLSVIGDWGKIDVIQKERLSYQRHSNINIGI
ncbi:hypothetical protein M413DRAFT_22058 [Hebeloma cylindrosporum]|uniref:F-box domain-containing protein n=1 Tax=Hebeloma cylindrosporum TaxID=76867 RepID=A0A0C3CU13_HEBCY|nr:hypothetical protein M413DRAFT_22058 [Hebeloma cylindrosporum h7]